MRLLIFGSREGVPPAVVRAYVASLPPDTTVITGGARGVDWVAAWAALDRWSRGELAGVEIYPAMWDVYGKGAGPERNARMAWLCDEGMGFRAAGVSRGTDDMKTRLMLLGKPVRVKHAEVSR